MKQQDTTDRSCMAGIRIKVERAWRRKHTTKETGDWQTFFFFFCSKKRMEWKVWSYEKIERERLPNRGGPFQPLYASSLVPFNRRHEWWSSDLWWPIWHKHTRWKWIVYHDISISSFIICFKGKLVECQPSSMWISKSTRMEHCDSHWPTGLWKLFITH